MQLDRSKQASTQTPEEERAELIAFIQTVVIYILLLIGSFYLLK